MKKMFLLATLIGVVFGVNAQIYFKANDYGSTSANIANDIQSIYSNIEIENVSDKISSASLEGGGYVALMQFDVLQNESYNDLIKSTSYTKTMRILLPMGEKEIHLVAKKNSSKKITSFSMVKSPGVKVALVKDGPGTAVTADVIKQLTGAEWTPVYAADLSEATRKLLDNTIDAFFYVGYAPSEGLNFFNTLPLPIQKNIVLLPLDDPELVGSYTPTVIKSNTYRWAQYDVSTYSVPTYLVTNTYGENEDIQNELVTLLRAIKSRQNDLSSSSTTQNHVWKRVKFDYSTVTWNLHPAVKKVGTN